MSILDQLRSGLSDRYSVVREIGMGGMATVYLAHDIRHDRDVALKVLSPELGAMLGPERFLSEIRVTAKLQHPNLLPLFDSGECEGQLFYVMPFVEGESLRARLARERQLPVREAVRLTSAIASALDYAHRHRVVHRDLKPENILLQDGHPLVADFGIALAVSNAGGERVTQTGLSLGTPQYMAPEQATGERSVDGRADIYSLGAVLYEMLTGEPPHSGATVQAIIARVLTETPKRVRLSRPLIPDHLDAAVAKALEKVPADRFETAQEFAEVLEGHKPITGARPTGASTASGAAHTKRTRALPWAVASAATTLALVTTAWSATQFRARQDARPEPVTFVLGRAALDRPGQNSVAVSPDGKTIALVSDEGNGAHLFLRELSQIVPRRINGTENASAPFFSPDGKWVAFFADGWLKRAPLSGGSVLDIANNLTARSAWWAPDNRIVIPTVAVTGRRGGFSEISASRGSVDPLIVSDTAIQENFAAPMVLDDGKTIVFESQGPAGIEDDKLAVGSMDGLEYTVIDFLLSKPLGYVDGHLVCLRWNGIDGAIVAVPFDLRKRTITGDPILIFDGVATVQGAWLSGSGTLVYVRGVAANRIVWHDALGRTVAVIAEPRAYSTPRLSPDGRTISFALPGPVTTDVWLYDIAASTLSRLTTASGGSAEWTPDGKSLLFIRPTTASAGLWYQPVDGSAEARQLRPLLPAGTAPINAAVMSRDSTIIFDAYAGSQRRNLYYFKPGTIDTARPLVASDFDEFAPRISPDGRWLAYVSDESGSSEVLVRPFPGPGPRLQVSSSGGSEPMWGRDGRQLFYRSGQRLMVIGFSSSPTPTVTTRRVMLDFASAPKAAGASYDLSVDGNRVLLPVPAGDDAALVVRTNFLTEVRRKLKDASH